MFRYLCEAPEDKFFENGFIDYANIPCSFGDKYPNALKSIGLENDDSIMLYFSDNKLLMSLIIILDSFKLMIYLANKKIVQNVITKKMKNIKYIITDLEFPSFEGSIEKIRILDKEINIYIINDLSSENKLLPENYFVFYTSGTNGNESKIIRSESVLFGEADAILKKLNWTEEDIVLCNAPTFHSFGQAFGCFAACLAKARVKYSSSFTLPPHLINELNENNYSILVSTPLYYNEIYKALLQMDNLKYMLSGGGRLGDNVINSGLKVNNVYGSTETGAMSLQDYKLGGDCGSAGTPMPGVVFEMGKKILKSNDKDICELIVHSEYIYSGKIEDKELILNTTTTFELDDIGYYDCYENIQIYGRKDDVVNIYGEKISLSEIEAILLECDFVNGAKVLKEEDSNGNDYLAALVTTSRKCSVKEILEYCRKRMDRYKIPKKFKIVDEFRRTETGKIIKKFDEEIL